MAVEENDVIQVELEADSYKLERAGGKVTLFLGGRRVDQDIFNVTVAENRDLSIIGRKLGKISPEKCTLELDDGTTESNLENVRSVFQKWYPPGNVVHIHKEEGVDECDEFDELKKLGIFVGKFSAEWCGPCKMVAPQIDALSLKYPDVTFVHVDSDELPGLFKREGIKAFPTFKIFLNGNFMEEVRGANAQKVENVVKRLGAVATAPTTSNEPVPNGTVNLVCARDVLRVEKTSSGLKFSVNGEVKETCPHIELSPETKDITFGRGGGKVWTEGGVDLKAIATKLAGWFPSKVKHVHGGPKCTAEFDGLVKDGITVVKYSASWCPPCKAIKADYIKMSNDIPDVTFLHVDVDQCSDLSRREKIEAMPTFHFFQNGEKKTSLMVRGANIPQVQANLRTLGVQL